MKLKFFFTSHLAVVVVCISSECFSIFIFLLSLSHFFSVYSFKYAGACILLSIFRINCTRVKQTKKNNVQLFIIGSSVLCSVFDFTPSKKMNYVRTLRIHFGIHSMSHLLINTEHRTQLQIHFCTTKWRTNKCKIILVLWTRKSTNTDTYPCSYKLLIVFCS